MPRVYLKQGRDRPVRNGHPWIFSGAIEVIEGDPGAAGIADVFDSEKHWIARGLFSPRSQIRVRVLTWEKEEVDRDFFTRRLSQALSIREKLLREVTNAYRIVNGEGDFLPGLIVDRYNEFLVCQFFTAGMDFFKPLIIDSLSSLLTVKGVFEKSEGRVRDEEGIEPSVGVLAGEPPPETISIEENGFKFVVDVQRGQKTGFFLDQRDNRAFLTTISREKKILNCFAYSGAFSVYALAGGAKEIVSLDSSRPALDLAERNLALNGFEIGGSELLKGDAFTYLKECDTAFEMIILDPPSLARKRGDVGAATGGYKFLNLHALRHVRPGGFLVTFSCSQHLSIDLFQKVVFGAAVDAGRRVTILKRLGQPIDHPVSLHHPEGEYLKGLVLRVLD
ncbi:MAG TPA: class I SAM-dependent rRNA methyltransferase [Candidatus Binatia bacterium]|nr:class I SAM-dependent rRNA methyltransferase [Candidatus Binatia bacterium]